MLKKYGAPSHTHTLQCCVCVLTCVCSSCLQKKIVCVRAETLWKCHELWTVSNMSHMKMMVVEHAASGSGMCRAKWCSGEAPSPSGLWSCQRLNQRRVLRLLELKCARCTLWGHWLRCTTSPLSPDLEQQGDARWRSQECHGWSTTRLCSFTDEMQTEAV